MKKYSSVVFQGLQEWYQGRRQGRGSTYPQDPLILANDQGLVAAKASNLEYLRLLRVDSSDQIRIADAFHQAPAVPIVFNLEANSKIATQAFFVNSSDTEPLEILGADCIFKTANGAALTGTITKEIDAQAPGAGVSVLASTFDLNATANTLQTLAAAGVPTTRTRFSSIANRAVTLNAGEQLSLSLSTAVTSLAGLSIIVWVRPALAMPPASLFLNANGDIATTGFYLNLIPGLKIRKITARFKTAGSDAGAVTLDVTKDASGTAAGGGTSVLSATQSLKATANTTYNLSLSGTAATLTMDVLDALAFKLTGTPTALAGLVISVFFENGPTGIMQISQSLWDAVATDRTLFIAKRWYKLDGLAAKWGVASSSGTLRPTRESSTTAPGSGAAMGGTLSTAATANTPLGSVIDVGVQNHLIGNGQRISLDHGGTTTNLAGAIATLLLSYR